MIIRFHHCLSSRGLARLGALPIVAAVIFSCLDIRGSRGCIVIRVSDLPFLYVFRFFQVGVVGEDRKFRILSEQEVKDFLDEAN